MVLDFGFRINLKSETHMTHRDAVGLARVFQNPFSRTILLLWLAGELCKQPIHIAQLFFPEG